MATAAYAFAQVGRALFGDHFKAPLAVALNVSVDRVDDWSKGRGNPPPAGVWRDLVQILDDRQLNLPRLRTAALAVANAAGLTWSAIDLQGTHVVVDRSNPSRGALHQGSYDDCERYVAQESEKALLAAAIASPAALWRLAAQLARECYELGRERTRRRLTESPFDDRNFENVLSHVFEAIDTGDRQAMGAALSALEVLRLRMPPPAHVNDLARQPARDLAGNGPTGIEPAR